MPPSVHSSLHAIFLGVRELYHVLGRAAQDRSLATLDVFYGGAMKSMVLQGHLLNYFLDTSAVGNLQESPELLAEALFKSCCVIPTLSCGSRNYGHRVKL